MTIKTDINISKKKENQRKNVKTFDLNMSLVDEICSNKD
jgi:hypothetical protein